MGRATDSLKSLAAKLITCLQKCALLRRVSSCMKEKGRRREVIEESAADKTRAIACQSNRK